VVPSSAVFVMTSPSLARTEKIEPNPSKLLTPPAYPHTHESSG
jgi:hypothetical protein